LRLALSVFTFSARATANKKKREDEMNTYLLATIVVGVLFAWGLYLYHKGYRE
jgi:heme/copper-type cytochrome/quinol oxidase subunit 3